MDTKPHPPSPPMTTNEHEADPNVWLVFFVVIGVRLGGVRVHLWPSVSIGGSDTASRTA